MSVSVKPQANNISVRKQNKPVFAPDNTPDNTKVCLHHKQKSMELTFYNIKLCNMPTYTNVSVKDIGVVLD
jgi:hypothetical protein